MSDVTSKFNMDFYYAEDLREVPKNPEEMRRGIEQLKDSLEKEDDELKRASLMSQIGSYARIFGDLDLAENMYNDALSVIENKGKVHHVLAIKLRLAIVYQWKKEYSKADNIFSKSIKHIEKTRDENVQKYLDFACQHYAKSLFEQGLYQRALDHLIRALELRLEKGDMSLVESTQKAIQICRDKLGEG